MNKLSKYSGGAAIVLAVLFLYSLLVSLRVVDVSGLPIFDMVVGIVVTLIIPIWFVILATTSAKGSPLRLPAIIGSVAVLTRLVSWGVEIAISSIGYENMSESLWNVNVSAYSLCLLLEAVALIWISFYFKRGSILQILAIVAPLLPVVVPLYPEISGDYEIFSNDIYRAISSCSYPLVASIFMLLFYRQINSKN